MIPRSAFISAHQPFQGHGEDALRADALQVGDGAVDLVGVDHGVDGDVIGIAGDLQDGGAAYAGQNPPDLVQGRLGDVGHDVLAPLGRYDAAYGAEDAFYLLPLGGKGLV
jgi:hypothetical protein